MRRSRFRPIANTVCLGGALVGGASLGWAQDAAKLDKLEKENQDLRRRLEALEAVAQKEGILPSGEPKTQPVKALSDIMISGFVTASYFYDTSTPTDRFSNGYLWNTRHNSFSLNKVKLTLASPAVERSGENWDAGYRVSLIFGEDAPLVNTGGSVQGFDEIREAYVELNAPVGTGLNIKAGQLISLLNYESGDGGAVNANFSQGYQWFFTGNGPAAGVQLGYTFTDWLEAKFRVQNGLYAGPLDGNDAKTLMGSLGIKPNANSWLTLIGFGGKESSSMELIGGSLLGGYKFTDKLNTAIEFDYFNFDLPGGDADLWSIGGWFTYDFTPVVGIAIRAEYLDDQDGAGLPGVPPGGFRGNAASLITSPDSDGDVASVALTLNIRPVANVKIQPEIRYDTTSYEDGFDGKESRFLIGMGVSYLF